MSSRPESGRSGGGGGGDAHPPSVSGSASTANSRKAALDKLLNKLKNVPNREALEEQRAPRPP